MNHMGLLNDKRVGLYDPETRRWLPVLDIKIANGCFQSVFYDQSDYYDSYFDYYILPGFVDAHCHMFENPFSVETCPFEAEEIDYSGILQIASKNVHTACKAGITSIKDLGGRFYYSISAARYLNQRGGASRIFTSGCYFTSRGGHCSDRGGIVIDDLSSFIHGVDYLTKNDIHFCKIIHGDEGFDQQLLLDMVREAHKRKMIVSCHSYTEKAARDAVIADVDILEHVGDYSDGLLAIIKEKGIIVVPTFVSAYDGLRGCSVLSDVNTTVIESWYNAEKIIIPKLFSNGIKVALGTDGGLDGTLFNSLIREILLIKHTSPSISIEDLLFSSFIITPQTIGMQDYLGKIQKGYFADFQIFDRDPVLNYEDTLGHPISVWVNGEEVYSRLETDSVIIRNLTVSDVKDLMKFINHPFFDCALSGDFWTENEIESWIKASHDCCVGAYLFGELIGFCLSHLHKEAHKVHIENIFVAEKYRDHGVGFRMLNEVICQYQNNSDQLRYVGLVDLDNAAAYCLLQKVGFNRGASFNWMQRNG